MLCYFRKLFERFIHRQIVIVVSKINLLVFVFLFSSLGHILADSDLTDSLRTHRLSEVNVNGQSQKTTLAALPIQIFSEKEIESLNSTNLSDIAKHFAGVTVKDYGGIGGLKTVSLRGLGASQTGVSYDGVIMSDVQTGQMDLGRFSIENISEISLSNGQPNDIFQSARMFASSGVLSFSTKMPVYNGNNTLTGRLTVKTGSFGLIEPTLFICKNFSPKLAISLSADGLKATGKYLYLSNINSQGNNTVEKTRINSDIQSLRTEMNAIYHLDSLEFISFKANQYYSERGLPGPDILYSTYSTDRPLDKDYFAQVHYENKKSTHFQYQLFAKYNSTFMQYTEVSPKYSQLSENKLVESYKQNEYYLSSTLQYHPTNNLFISSSVDGWYNNLFSHDNNLFSKDTAPIRYTGLGNIAVKYLNERLSTCANLLYTATRETTQTGAAAPNRNKLSPTVSLSYQLVESKELRLRAFYKNIFRLPTFSDEYYHDLGYVNLLPETTNQYDIGLVYRELKIPFISELELSLDAYYNQIKDKITVIYGMPYSSIRNIGSVDIKAIDANLRLAVPINRNSFIHFRVNYTYQRAQDLTSGSENYGEQIPYTPFHSGSTSLSYQYKEIECGYNILYSGKRWDGQNIDANLLESYIEHSLFCRIASRQFKLMGEIINLFNSQYQVIKNYPMPGRNYRITLSMEINKHYKNKKKLHE